MTTSLPTLAIDAHFDGLIYGASQRAILRLGGTALVSEHEGRAAGLEGRGPHEVHVAEMGEQPYRTLYDRITGGWLLRAVRAQSCS